MSFADCVESAVRAGSLTRDQAEDLYRQQQDATDRFTLDSQHSPESAARLAEELGIERAKQDVRLRKYQAALQAIKNSVNTDRVLNYPLGESLGVRTVLARDAKGRATWLNVDSLKEGILGQAHATMAKGISLLRTRWLGLHRSKQLLLDTVREMHPNAKTGNIEARGIAQTWAKAAENLRLRFNRAGGAIPRLTDWGMPHEWDQVLTGRVSVGKWVDIVKNELDLERTIDVETGAPFTPDSIEVVLQGVYNTISTNGIADMIPGAQGGKKLASRRQQSRFLIFKDADAWLRVNDQFGSQNLYGTMMSHLDGMSRDIALLETLGPNPAAGFKVLQDVAAKAENKPLRRAKNQRLFNIVNGTGDRNVSPFMANIFGAIRSWNVASMLGSAALSAVSDIGFMGLTDRWVGMSFTRQLRGYLSQMNPSNEADRILATRMGITGLSATSAYSNIGRFSEISGAGGGFLGKIANAGNIFAEVTIRASGLSAMTDAGRRSFAIEYAANLAENFGKRLDDVEGNFGLSLRERGMTPEEWDLLRQTPTTDHNGARFFTVDQLMDRQDIPLSKREQLAGRIQLAIREEMLHAVPEPDALVRTGTTLGQPRGSIIGEVARSGLQFKSFPFAVLSLHLQRALSARQLRGGMMAAAYAAHGIVSTTLLGMLALQLKLISKGKDPRDMDDPKAWAAAFIQGGGAGIYGDFLFHDANRFGSGPITTLSGPSIGLAEDVTRMTWGNVQQLMVGEDPKLAADVVGFSKRYMPFGSLWYTRLILEREVWDQLAEEADPRGARRRNARQEKRAREQGTKFWWRPGRRLPDRAPDVGAE